MVRTSGNYIALPPARAISFPLVRTTTLGQSVYPDIALHISNYFINIPCDCGQYTRIFSRGTLNCMDVLHRIFVILYFNSEIIHQNFKKKY